MNASCLEFHSEVVIDVIERLSSSAEELRNGRAGIPVELRPEDMFAEISEYSSLLEEDLADLSKGMLTFIEKLRIVLERMEVLEREVVSRMEELGQRRP